MVHAEKQPESDTGGCFVIRNALPHFLALVTNLLYSWPPGENKLRHALHPCEVIAFNYTTRMEHVLDLLEVQPVNTRHCTN